MTDDTWASQDLPVLRAAVAVLDDPDSFHVGPEHLMPNLDGFTDAQIKASLRRLTIGGYLSGPPAHSRRSGWTSGDSVVEYHGEALRAVGMWPSPEVALDRLVQALEAAAAGTDDPEVQTALRKTARWLGATATNVGAGVAAAVIAGGV